MGEVGEHVEARGHDVRRGARVPRVPHERPAAEALRGGGARGARDAAAVEELRPECVVADILTLAPAMAGEMAGVPVATRRPARRPAAGAGLPAVLDGRAAAADGGRPRGCGACADRVVAGGLRARAARSSTRRAGGSACRRTTHVHNGISRDAVPRRDAAPARVPARRAVPEHARRRAAAVGDPGRAGGRAAAGRRAGRARRAVDRRRTPSTACCAPRSTGLADEPVRVIATWNRREPDPPLDVPDNAVVVDWLSYAKTMPACDVVVCHAGHGTVVRALASGCAVVCCPAAGDMNENAARVDWAGLGTRLPRRLVTPRGVRLAVRKALDTPRDRARACARSRRGARAHDGAARGGRPGRARSARARSATTA